MIPGGLFTPTGVEDDFIDPLDAPYDPLKEIVPGGDGLNNGAMGRLRQRWTVDYVGGLIRVYAEDSVVVLSLAVPGVQTVSLGFDSNMQPAIAYCTPDGAFLYYYDNLLDAFATLSIPGATSARATIDEPRAGLEGASDVIFAYVLSNVLYYRQQRDRYLTPYTIGTANSMQLLRAGPNIRYRLQFRLG